MLRYPQQAPRTARAESLFAVRNARVGFRMVEHDPARICHVLFPVVPWPFLAARRHAKALDQLKQDWLLDASNFFFKESIDVVRARDCHCCSRSVAISIVHHSDLG